MRPNAAAALELVQLAELLRQHQAFVYQSLTALIEAHTGLATDSSTAVTISADELRSAVEGVSELESTARRIGELAANIPTDRPVELRGADLREAAAEALASGSDTFDSVVVFARCLPPVTGYAALAEVLTTSSCYRAWGDATIGELLTAFPGVDVHAAVRVTDVAQLSPARTWATCSRSDLQRLAAALDPTGHGRTRRHRHGVRSI